VYNTTHIEQKTIYQWSYIPSGTAVEQTASTVMQQNKRISKIKRKKNQKSDDDNNGNDNDVKKQKSTRFKK